VRAGEDRTAVVLLRDGGVSGYGGFDVSGRVAHNGAVVVQIGSGG